MHNLKSPLTAVAVILMVTYYNTIPAYTVRTRFYLTTEGGYTLGWAFSVLEVVLAVLGHICSSLGLN
jgi:hypothetical protein